MVLVQGPRFRIGSCGSLYQKDIKEPKAAGNSITHIIQASISVAIVEPQPTELSVARYSDPSDSSKQCSLVTSQKEAC